MDSNINLRDCVAAVAVGLGDRLNVKVQFDSRAETAYTDGETIHIPSSVMTAEPVWVWGYLVHEAAHIRFSSFEEGIQKPYIEAVRKGDSARNIPPLAVSESLFMSCWNCIEDAMIERLILEPFPGIEGYLSNLRETMVQKGYFSGPQKGENNAYGIVQWYSFYRAFTLGTKQVAYEQIYAAWRQLMEAMFEKQHLVELDDIIDRNATAKTTEDTLSITQGIFHWLAKRKEESGQSDQSDSTDQSSQQKEGNQAGKGQQPEASGDSGNSDQGQQPQGDGNSQQGSSKNQDQNSDSQNQKGSSSQGEANGKGENEEQNGQNNNGQNRTQNNDQSASNGQSDQNSDGQSSEANSGESAQNGKCENESQDKQSTQQSANGQNCQGASSDSQSSNAQADANQLSGTSGQQPQSQASEVGQSKLDWSNADKVEKPTSIEDEIKKHVKSNPNRSRDGFERAFEAALENMGTEAMRKADRDSLLTRGQATLNSVGQSQRIFDALKRHVYAIGATQRTNRRAGKRFDIRRINRIMAGDLRVFNGPVPHMEPNAHVKILIDMSYSMHAKGGLRALNALTGALAIYQAFQLGKATIPVTIDGFGSMPMSLTFKNETALQTKQVLERSMFHLATTDLARALIYSGFDLARQREKRKVLLVLTDGKPTDCDLDSEDFAKTLELLKHNGIEIFFIGILLNHNVLEVLRSVVGHHLVADVQDIDQLAQEMFNTIGHKMCDYLNA